MNNESQKNIRILSYIPNSDSKIAICKKSQLKNCYSLIALYIWPIMSKTHLLLDEGKLNSLKTEKLITGNTTDNNIPFVWPEELGRILTTVQSVKIPQVWFDTKP